MPFTVAEEGLLFAKAVTDYAETPNSSEAICTIMQLAMEAKSPTQRRWAAQWLQKHCNIAVVTDVDQGELDHAASAKAEGILR